MDCFPTLSQEESSIYLASLPAGPVMSGHCSLPSFVWVWLRKTQHSLVRGSNYLDVHWLAERMRPQQDV